MSRPFCTLNFNLCEISEQNSASMTLFCGNTLRYREAVELADALGYDLIWQKRR